MSLPGAGFPPSLFFTLSRNTRIETSISETNFQDTTTWWNRKTEPHRRVCLVLFFFEARVRAGLRLIGGCGVIARLCDRPGFGFFGIPAKPVGAPH